jgi:hypothetical protein
MKSKINISLQFDLAIGDVNLNEIVINKKLPKNVARKMNAEIVSLGLELMLILDFKGFNFSNKTEVYSLQGKIIFFIVRELKWSISSFNMSFHEIFRCLVSGLCSK